MHSQELLARVEVYSAVPAPGIEADAIYRVGDLGLTGLRTLRADGMWTSPSNP